MKQSPARKELLTACLGTASVTALVLSGLEVGAALLADNALLDGLPLAERLRYFGLVLASFPVLGVLCGLLGFAVASWHDRPGRVAAAALPGLVTCCTAMLVRGEVAGGGASVLAGAAVGAAALFGILAGVRPRLLPDRAGPVLVGLGALAFIGLWLCPALGMEDEEGVFEEPFADETASGAPPPIRNLIVLMVDTLRADHLGCYGYHRATSPQIDAFAAQGTLFENAATPKPKTSAAVASLFTGTWPQTHRVHRSRAELLPENVTLAETLSEAGFATYGVSANVNINKSLGFGQGFDEFHWITRATLKDGTQVDNDARALATHLVQWIGQHEGARFFAYAHFIDPHTPYRAPAPFQEMFVGDEFYGTLGSLDQDQPLDTYMRAIEKSVYLPEAGFDLDQYVARYDGEIRYTDAVIGGTLLALEELGVADSTLVVFLSDHGESITEHDAYFNHGLFPYESQVHVPLILRGPGIPEGLRRPEQVSLTALMPTLLELLGVPPPDSAETQSFADLVRADTVPGDGIATLLSARTPTDGMIRGLRTNRWKYLRNPAGRSVDQALGLSNLLWIGHRLGYSVADLRPYELEEELYDLTVDDREAVNLAPRRPATCAALRERLKAVYSASTPLAREPRVFKASEFGKEAQADLIKLGYGGR